MSQSDNYNSCDDSSCSICNKKQIKYYHTHLDKQFRPKYEVKPMFSNIESYDYKSPLKSLSKYYGKSGYYHNIYKKYKDILIEKKSLDKYSNITDQDKDIIMLQYIKCKPSCFVMTLWKPLDEQHMKSFIDYLELYGNIYMIKNIKLSKKAIKNLMVMFYDEFRFRKKEKFIEQKVDNIGITDENNDITFIVFDNIKEKKLSGPGASFKKKLRHKLKKYNKNIKSMNLIHVNDYFYQLIEYSQIIFNQNSLNNLDNLSLYKTSKDEKMLEANLLVQSYRKFLYTKLTLLEIDKLFALNESLDKDIQFIKFLNVIIVNYSKDCKCCSKYEKLLNKYMIDKKTRFDFLKLNKKYHLSRDIALDPQNYMYFQGVKFLLKN